MKAKAYIVHRAMCAPELEWSKPKDCLSAEPLYTSPPAQQQEKAPPEQWRERWYGSLAEKGWWICCGREHIAHLGTEVSSDEVRKIVDAHNRYKPAALQKEPAQQQEPLTWKDEQGNVRMTLDAGGIQSSVGYVYSVHGERIKNACIRSDIPNGTPLYTSPPAQRKPLTDEQLRKVHHEDQFGLFYDYDEFEHIARAIERAHGIKENT